MGNVLSREKREQAIALGRLGWSLRRIEQATGVRRETAGDYLRSAGIGVRSPGSWGEKSLSKAATSVTSGSDSSKPANTKAASLVTTGFLPERMLSEQDGRRSVDVSEAYREMIELELSRGRNAMGIWQDLVDGHGFAGGYQSVKRFVRKLRGAVSSEAPVIIETRPGEESQVDYGTGPTSVKKHSLDRLKYVT
jgi:hypothetical protein